MHGICTNIVHKTKYTNFMNTTLEECKKQMSKIKQDITARDRKDAHIKLGYSYNTIATYATNNEKATNQDTYIELISFSGNKLKNAKPPLHNDSLYSTTIQGDQR